MVLRMAPLPKSNKGKEVIVNKNYGSLIGTTISRMSRGHGNLFYNNVDNYLLGFCFVSRRDDGPKNPNKLEKTMA